MSNHTKARAIEDLHCTYCLTLLSNLDRIFQISLVVDILIDYTQIHKITKKYTNLVNKAVRVKVALSLL